MKLSKKQIEELIAEALLTREKAYAPYSLFKVGAVVIDENNNKYYGVNIENGSYGLTNCAERTAIFNAVLNGAKTITAVVVVGNTPEPLVPCGACLQVISEFAKSDTLIIMANTTGKSTVATFAEVLPFCFKFKGPNAI